MHWQQHTDRILRLLNGVVFSDARCRSLATDRAFARWRRMTLDVRRRSGTVYMIGNGASASMASHFAADLAKNAHVHTQVFSDLSLITAISNDMGYQHVFAEPLRRRGKRGDILVAISSSGKSPNVLAACVVARQLGMHIATLSAFSPDNPLRRAGALNAYVAADTYGAAETCHSAILHYWLDQVVEDGES